MCSCNYQKVPFFTVYVSVICPQNTPVLVLFSTDSTETKCMGLCYVSTQESDGYTDLAAFFCHVLELTAFSCLWPLEGKCEYFRRVEVANVFPYRIVSVPTNDQTEAEKTSSHLARYL